MVDPPPDFEAYDGTRHAWPPPTGWWQATDGKWFPPQQAMQAPRRRTVPLVPAVALVAVVFVAVASIAALVALRLTDSTGGEQTVPQAPTSSTLGTTSGSTATSREGVSLEEALGVDSRTPLGTTVPTHPQPPTMPSGDRAFIGYPLLVPVDSIDRRVARSFEGATEVVALAPGVYAAYNSLVPDLESYMDGPSSGDCAMRRTYFPRTGGSCWDGVGPGSAEPEAP